MYYVFCMLYYSHVFIFLLFLKAEHNNNYNNDKCGDLGWVCVPLVTETYGAWGPEAMACFSQLALRLSMRFQKPKSVILHELYGRLNTCLIHCVATAILSRIQSS